MRPWLRRLLSIFAIFMSAYSLASMLLAYFALEANVSDASNSLINWVSPCARMQRPARSLDRSSTQ